MASKSGSQRGSALVASTGWRNKRDNLHIHNQCARNQDTRRQATPVVAGHTIAQGGGDIADPYKHNTATNNQHTRRMAVRQIAARDSQQKRTENIASVSCGVNNSGNMSTATQEHRRRNIRQTPESQEQCIET